MNTNGEERGPPPSRQARGPFSALPLSQPLRMEMRGLMYANAM